MTRLARIPLLLLIALAAVGVGSVLPFSPAVAAVAVADPTEEEKASVEPSNELVLTVASPAPKSQSPPRTAARASNPRTTSPRRYHSQSDFVPAVALNNGLAAFYRC
jgi:hypothetical protein